MEPNVTWGTSPGMVVGVNGKVREFDSSDIYNKDDIRNALNYMGLQPGTAIKDINIDAVLLEVAQMEELKIYGQPHIINGNKIAKGLELLLFQI